MGIARLFGYHLDFGLNLFIRYFSSLHVGHLRVQGEKRSDKIGPILFVSLGPYEEIKTGLCTGLDSHLSFLVKMLLKYS